MQSSIFLWLSQARINWEGCGRKGIWHKTAEGIDGGGLLISLDGVSASCYPPQHHSLEEAFFWHRLTRVVAEKGP